MKTTWEEDIEAAKLAGYNACEKVYRNREEAWDAERAELVENLRSTQEKLSELRKYTAGPYGLKAAHVGNLIMQCIDGGYDLEISEARTAIGRVGYKVRVDPATRTVLKAGIFDAIEEMLKEVRPIDADESIREARRHGYEVAGEKVNGQLTIGALIDVLDAVPRELPLRIDGHARLRPVTSIASYRGYYEDVAIGYGSDRGIRFTEGTTVGALRDELEQAVKRRRTIFGYKGGTWQCYPSTVVWVANFGDATHAAVTGVVVRRGKAHLTISGDFGGKLRL
jgi:hypothetical protein